jgi:DNA-binding IclR family transcriptional regulator
MIHYSNPLALVAIFHGTPLTCLLAMSLAGRPVSARWLSFATGYSLGRVYPALEQLLRWGLVERHGSSCFRIRPSSKRGTALIEDWYRRN